MIRLATVFTGIGSVEHALQRLNIKHKIVFACDNGGVNIFGKNIADNFKTISEEILYLENHIKHLKINEFEDYIEKLQSDIENLRAQFEDVKKSVVEKEIDFEKIISTLKIAMKVLKEKEIKEFKQLEIIEKQDISDILVLVNEIPKYLSKEGRAEELGLVEETEFLIEVTKDKIYRKVRREIKEIPKKLSELHGTIGSLEVLSELSQIPESRDKKKYVDNLYVTKEKGNFVKKSYFSNYDIKDDHFHWNVSFLDGTEYKNKVDLFVGGSPCQSFSMVGKRKGFSDTRGTLFYEYVRLLKEIEPRFFIYENVQGVLSHDEGQTWEIMQNAFKEAGYDFKHYILNARDFGIPQNRNRIFVIGFKNKSDFEKFEDPKKVELKQTMQDLLEDTIDEKYFLPEKGLKFVTDEKNIEKKYTQINGNIALCQKANQQFNWHGDFIECYTEEELVRLMKIDPKYFLSEKVKSYVLSEEDAMIKPETDLKIARPLTATMHKMHRAGVDNYITYGAKLEVKDRKIRKLTPRECFRLMGYCDSFKIVV
ncbi:MAG: DNA (cytosine-5-)-methyltransferase, partial [Fusobacteriaceae bacterium]